MLTDEEKLWQVWGQAGSLYDFWAASKNINYYLLFVLYALDGQKAMTQKKICNSTGLTKQTVNNVIRSLKKEGYVILSPGTGDKREKQVSLTEEGASYARELLAPLKELERRSIKISTFRALSCYIYSQKNRQRNTPLYLFFSSQYFADINLFL